jgi:uncharacterized membrane protein
MLSFLFGVVVLGLDIWAILNVFKSRATDGAKIGWLIGILIFPLLGFVVWALAGPKDTMRLPRF